MFFPRTLYPGRIRTGSSVPEAEAMSTAPRRQGRLQTNYILKFVFRTHRRKRGSIFLQWI
jgi:hypothetical protein